MKNWKVDDKVIYIKSSSFLTVTDSDVRGDINVRGDRTD